MAEKNPNPIIQADGIEMDQSFSVYDEFGQNPLRNVDDFQTFEVTAVVPYDEAADFNYYPVFYVASQPCFVLEASMKHGVAGAAGATADVEYLTSGTARWRGTSVLVGTFDLSGTANTIQRRTPSVAGIRTTNLNPGDALSLRATGTLTAVRHVTVTVLLGMNTKNIPTSAQV